MFLLLILETLDFLAYIFLNGLLKNLIFIRFIHNFVLGLPSILYSSLYLMFAVFTFLTKSPCIGCFIQVFDFNIFVFCELLKSYVSIIVVIFHITRFLCVFSLPRIDSTMIILIFL